MRKKKQKKSAVKYPPTEFKTPIWIYFLAGLIGFTASVVTVAQFHPIQFTVTPLAAKKGQNEFSVPIEITNDGDSDLSDLKFYFYIKNFASA